MSTPKTGASGGSQDPSGTQHRKGDPGALERRVEGASRRQSSDTLLRKVLSDSHYKG